MTSKTGYFFLKATSKIIIFTMPEFISLLAQFSPWQQFVILFLENLGVLLFALVFGLILDGNFSSGLKKFSPTEIKWLVLTLFFNSVITFLGFRLYCLGYIIFNFESNWGTFVLHLLILIVIMDFVLFALHSIIHKFPLLYKIHALHHLYRQTTAIDLFVLHPLEVLGFGFIWLMVLMVIPFNFYAVCIYLIFNVTMGIIGHVEKDHSVFKKLGWLSSWLGDTKFHRQHHEQEDSNFGFYLTIWDKVFRSYKKE